MSDVIWGRLNGWKENSNGVNLPSTNYKQNMFIFNWNLYLDSQEPKKSNKIANFHHNIKKVHEKRIDSITMKIRKLSTLQYLLPLCR